MDRRLTILGGAIALLAAVVVVGLVAQGDAEEAEDFSTSIEASAEKPTVEIPEGDRPTELVTEDLTVGEGPAAEPGDTVSVQYVGVLYGNGNEFDSNWGSGQPFEVELGAGQVIQGWDQGLEGMQVGGVRRLIIPPDLAYGEAGSPPAIPQNATLVFQVELVGLEK